MDGLPPAPLIVWETIAMNLDIYAEARTRRSVKKPAAQKIPTWNHVRGNQDLDRLDPKTRRIVLALRRLYGTA